MNFHPILLCRDNKSISWNSRSNAYYFKYSNFALYLWRTRMILDKHFFTQNYHLFSFMSISWMHTSTLTTFWLFPIHKSEILSTCYYVHWINTIFFDNLRLSILYSETLIAIFFSQNTATVSFYTIYIIHLLNGCPGNECQIFHFKFWQYNMAASMSS